MPDDPDPATLATDVDGPRLADLIDSREDIADLRPMLKRAAKQARDDGQDTKIKDLLALSRKNDTAYIRPVDMAKAEWFAEIYAAEGRPETHPRAMHYRILGRYETRDGETYQNEVEHWQELKEGAYWAQILGLVDGDRIQDSGSGETVMTSQPPERPAGGDVSEVIPRGMALDIDLDVRFESATVDVTLELPELDIEDVDELIETEARRTVDRVFETLQYEAAARQDYYIEIWTEGSGVVDASLAREFGATLRQSGRGEMSYQMCQDAVAEAERRGQDLVVVMVTDFDPKGRDMPKSAARKIELEAALHEIEAEVQHAAVTLEQVETHGIPGTPAKTPDGLGDENPGAKAYERQKKLFQRYAGQHPVEIHSFQAVEPEAFRESVRETIRPYYDADLGMRIDGALAEAKREARDRLVDAWQDRRDEIAAAIEDLETAIRDMQVELESHFDAAAEGIEKIEDRTEAVADQLGLEEKAADLEAELAQVDPVDVLRETDIDLPSPEVGEADDALLDTRRSFYEQIQHYKQFDIRYS